jgi:catechol 2,3-dioxygenase-like lactoylglutathione lyase family enzyme
MTTRLQHVSVPRPPGSDDRARAFYGGLLGLEELPPPAALEGVLWYRLGAAELHLFSERERLPELRQHLCLEVDDLEALRERLEVAGVATQDATPIPGRPRFFCRDPFGNRLEFTAVTGDYRELG